MARRSSICGARAGTGQFSVAGDTVIFVPGQLQDRAVRRRVRKPTTILLATLGEATTLAALTFIGPNPAFRFCRTTDARACPRLNDEL